MGVVADISIFITKNALYLSHMVQNIAEVDKWVRSKVI